MARKPQSDLVFGYPQNVYWGSPHHPCFNCNDDFQVYRLALETVRRKYACRVHAYLIMGNYVHLLATADQGWSLYCLMDSVTRRYNRYRKQAYGRPGLIPDAHCSITGVDMRQCLLTQSVDLELRPVREGLVGRPDRYRWSSYSANALGRLGLVISHHDVYLELGETDAQRQAAYQRLFKRTQAEDGRKRLAGVSQKRISSSSSKAF